MLERVILSVTLLVTAVSGCSSPGVNLDDCLATSDSLLDNAIRAEYDEFTDSTEVTTANQSKALGRLASQLGAIRERLASQLGETREGDVDFLSIARFQCQGSGICRPDSLEVLLHRASSSREFPDSAEIIFLMEGVERLRLGHADVSAGVDRFLGETIVEELASVRVAYDDFVRVACSDSVRFRVGNTEGALDSTSIHEWRGLVAAAEGSFTLEKLQNLQETHSPSNQGDSDRTERSPQIPEGSLTTPSWMQLNHEREQVHIRIIAAETSANMNGWNYNGYYGGNATIVVPEGYEVTIEFHNNDRVNPHSLGIDEQVGGYPANFSEVTPAFEGAVTEGANAMGTSTQPGESETIVFTASEAGEYAMVCYVPAHANQGMWIHFKVSGKGRVGVWSG